MGTDVSFTGRQNELTTGKYSSVVVDENNVPIPGPSLVSLTLTLYDYVTQAIINGRNRQNVLNAANVTVDGSGNVVWLIQPADNPILNDSLSTELHIARFDWTYNSGGSSAGKHAIGLRVINFALVP